MLLYYDPCFLEHDTGLHPENAARLLPAIRHLDLLAMGASDGSCYRPRWHAATLERIQRVHKPEYINELREFAARGGGYIEQDTIVSRKSVDVALMAAGAACDAVERIERENDTTAFCLVRPPGHHALPDHAMGFCLFNNVAVAARVATDELGLERILIVDWDVHHGNGTQAVFWTDPKVGYFSMHRNHFYPYTGAADESGSGAGAGTTRNLPIEFGTARQAQIERFEVELSDFADQIRPQLVLISAGFDAHKDDPIGSLGLESEDFARMTMIVKAIASEHAGGKIISVLEGGYNPDVLAECIDLHLSALA